MAKKRSSKHRHPSHKIIRDLVIVVVSCIAALLLVHFGAFDFLVGTSERGNIIGSFIAGSLFTSMFTIAPASVVLAQISHTMSPYEVALWGAFGSMLGDLVLFTFIKDNLEFDAEEIVRHSRYKRLLGIFRMRFFRYLMPLLGAIVIASPFPDEIGLAMMGMTNMRKIYVLPITFVMGYLGILTLCLIARTI